MIIPFNTVYLKLFSLLTRFCFFFQIQNADDVLISPLERFRKEQIGAVKVNRMNKIEYRQITECLSAPVSNVGQALFVSSPLLLGV